MFGPDQRVAALKVIALFRRKRFYLLFLSFVSCEENLD